MNKKQLEDIIISCLNRNKELMTLLDKDKDNVNLITEYAKINNLHNATKDLYYVLYGEDEYSKILISLIK